MHCLHCDREILKEFIDEWSRTDAATSGRFSCPHCTAEHQRRLISHLPSGEPQYSIRLWGHLSRNRKKKPPSAP